MFKKDLFSLLLHVLVQESGSRFSTVVTIVVLSHEAANSSNRGVLPKAGDLSIGFHSVVLEWLERDGLVDSLDLLGLGVDLLFALLTSTTKTKDQVKSALLLDIIVRKGSSVFQLLSSEDQSLLVRWNTLFILNFGLYIVDCVGGFNIKSDGLTWKRRKQKNESVRSQTSLKCMYIVSFRPWIISTHQCIDLCVMMAWYGSSTTCRRAWRDSSLSTPFQTRPSPIYSRQYSPVRVFTKICIVLVYLNFNFGQAKQ